MNDEKDPPLESIIEANRQAINRLRSMTEDLAAVVEHEKRVVEEVFPATPLSRSTDDAEP